MAVNKFTGATNSNWGTSTNWSQGTVPTANDGHVTTFDGTSPACTVNTSVRVCNNLDFTGYTNTITMTFGITVSGNITLSSTMIIEGSGGIGINAASTLTSNGKTFPNAVTFSGTTVTYTFADNWTVNGTFTSTTTTATWTGSNLYLAGSFTHTSGTISGTTNLFFNGTGTWSGAGTLKVNLTINSTASTTMSGTINYNTGTLTTVIGATITNSSATITLAAGTTLDNNNVALPSFVCGTSLTLTLLSDANVNSIVCNGSAAAVAINGLFNCNVRGSFTVAVNTNVSGTATLVFTSSGTITVGATSGRITNNIVIDTASTITLANLMTGNNSITVVSGTLNSTGTVTLLNASTTTLDLNGQSLNNVTTAGSSIIVLNSVARIAGTLTLGGNTTYQGAYGFDVNNYSDTNAGGTHTFASTVTYRIRNSITITATAASKKTFTSSSGSVQAILTLDQGATQDIGFCNATRIDSSQGQTLWTYKGTLTTATNWNLLPVQPGTISSATTN